MVVSAAFFEMVMQGRVARRVEDPDDDTLRAIGHSSVPEEHAAVDEIVTETEDFLWSGSAASAGRETKPV